VTKGKEPPPSTYPTLASGNLVSPADAHFPTIRNLPAARIPYQPYRMDLGARWNRGIIEREPPTLGPQYPIFVSRMDSVGNEVGGIRSVEVMVPLATYYPWQLRTGMPAATGRLVSFRGTFIPLPKTDAERRSTSDSRPSIESLYKDKSAFTAHVDDAISTLIGRRLMLAEDSTVARARMLDIWNRYGLSAH
ncbi:MAG: alpha/beta hydrolase domain-containing protein, partial [Gemmatimonadaceae bacterium]